MATLPPGAQFNVMSDSELARAVTGARKRDRITPTLAGPHWLPIAACIDIKVVLLTFKTLATGRPSYLHELLQVHSRSASSAALVELTDPRACMTTAPELHSQVERSVTLYQLSGTSHRAN